MLLLSFYLFALQLSECLSATNICEQNMFPMCYLMFMQHTSHSDEVSI